MINDMPYWVEIDAVPVATFANLVDAVAWGLWERTRRMGIHRVVLRTPDPRVWQALPRSLALSEIVADIRDRLNRDKPDMPSPGDGWPENATELPS